MQRKFRAAGWVLLRPAVTLVSVIRVTIGATRAHGAAEFNRWVGRATVAAVPVAAMGLVLVLWTKITGDNGSNLRVGRQ